MAAAWESAPLVDAPAASAAPAWESAPTVDESTIPSHADADDGVKIKDFLIAPLKGSANMEAGLSWLAQKFVPNGSLPDLLFKLDEVMATHKAEKADKLMSPGAHREGAKSFVDRVPDEPWYSPKGYKQGDATLSTVALTAAESAPGMIPGMGIGAGASKGLSVVPQLAPAISARIAEQFPKLAKYAPKLADALGFGIGEGAVGAAQNGRQTEQQVLQMPLEKLEASPEFQAALAKTNDPEAARGIVARAAGNDSAALSFLADAAFGAPGGLVFGKLFRGAPLANGKIASIATGAATEGAQEFAQSGGEQLGSNVAIQRNADPSQDLSENVANQAVGGALSGAMMGAPLGVIHGGNSSQQQRPAWESAPEIGALPAPAPFVVSPEGAIDTGTGAPVAEAAPINPDAVAQQHPAYPNEREQQIPALPAPAPLPVNSEGQAVMPGQQEEFAAQQQQQQAEQIAQQHPGYARETPLPEQPSAIDAMEPLDITQAYQPPAPKPDINSLQPIDSRGREVAAAPPAPAPAEAVVDAKPAVAPAIKSVDPIAKQRKFKRALQMRQINSDSDELQTAIAKFGGVNRSDAEAQGIDKAHFNERRGILPVFSKDGLSVDEMAEALSQHGYVPENYSANDLLDKISSSLAGEWVGTPEGLSKKAERDYQQAAIDRAMQEADDEAIASHIPEGERGDESPAHTVIAGKLLDAIDEGLPQHAIDQLLDDHANDADIIAALHQAREDNKNAADEYDAEGATDRQGSDQAGNGAPIETARSQEKGAAESVDSTDLFGDVPVTKQSVADLQREKDSKRNGTRDIPADIDGGLFSNQQNQTDLLDAAAHEAATSPKNNLAQPSDAQKEAGNYKVGRVNIHGLNISIENPRGSERTGKRADGSTWSHTMSDHYGYITGHGEGADGDHPDVYIGPKPESEKVYVVDQLNQKDGSFDEHKILLGYPNRVKAVNAYKSNFDKGWKVGPITEMPIAQFKEWLKGDTTKPLAARTAEVQAKAKTLPKRDGKVSETPTAKIDDFGEVLAGAKKHYAAAYADQMNAARAEDVAAVPLSKSWPEPDYVKLLADGADPFTVGWVRASRDEIPTKPKKSWRLKGWVQQVELLRDISEKMLSGRITAEQIQEKLTSYPALNGLNGRAELYQEFGHETSLKGIVFESRHYQMYHGENNVEMWVIEKSSSASAFSNWPTNLASGKTRETALENFKIVYAKLQSATEKADTATRFDVYSRKGQNGFIIGKKVGSTYIDLERFDTAVAAREHLQNNQADLEAKLKKMKEIPNERRATNAPRIGIDHRGGGNVTPEQFSEAFGFRGGQFGESMPNSERQAHLNSAYDALMDLAGVLNLPPKALSLNGELGLAFGARGNGGKGAPSAHYERGNININLTRKNGAGSLAHELWHAIDNYFSRARRDNDGYVTEKPYKRGDGVRAEMVDAFKNITQAIAQSRLQQRSQMLDNRRSKEYWTTGREMSARSFESYIIAKLQDQGASNDYLANIVSEDYWKAAEALGMEEGESYPYPQAAELPKIRAAFDEFFQAVETKETDSGIAMFSLRDNGSTAARKNGPVSKTDAYGVIAKFNAGRRAGDNGDIRLVESFSELPAKVQYQAYLEGANPNYIDGVFHNGKVYLVRDRLDTIKRVEQVLFHEAYGHYGLRGLFGESITQQMNQLYLAIGGSKGFVELAKRHEIPMREYTYGVLGADPNKRNAAIAEELLAHIAEDSKPSIARRASEIIGAIRAWLRNHGLVTLAKFNDADIMHLLKRARDVVNKGKGFGDGSRFIFREDSTMFSRRQAPEQPDPWTEPTETERAALHKLGLGPRRRRPIAEVIADAKAFNWHEAIDQLKQRQYEGWVDGLIGLKRAELAIGRGIGAGDYQNSAYVGATLATGIADVMHAVTFYGAPQWKDGVLQYKPGTRGLMEVLSDLKGDELTKWLGWMGGNRANELMAQGRENNLTAADIKSLTDMARGNEAKFERIRQEYLKINSAMLDVAQEAGLINPDSRAAWQSDWYVPFYRAIEAEDGDVSVMAPNRKSNLSGQKSGIEQLKGGTTATNDLLSNILHNWLTLTNAAMKNSAMLKAVETLRGTGYLTQESENRSDPDVVRAMRNGAPEYYRVHDDSVLRAVKHLGMRGDDSSFMKAGRWFKRLLTTGVTASPDFILRNFIRDAAQAWAINPDGFSFGRDSMRGMKMAFAEDQTYRDLMFAGASFQGGFIHGADPEAAAQMVRRAMKSKGYGDGQIQTFLDSTLDTGGKLWSALQMGWEHYREVGDKVENSNRVATYARALEAGKDRAQSAYEAKDLMDFSRRGNFKALIALTDVIPFLNARLQGLDKLARTGMKSNAQRWVFAGNLAKIVAWSMLLAWLNKDDERYKELPDWDKDSYWHFWLGDHHFRLPKPFEIGLIAGTLPERMVNAWIFDTQTNKALVDSMMHNLYGTLSFNPIPQAVLPAFEAFWMNRSVFFDKPIENEHDKKVQPAERYDANTSPIMRSLGGVIGNSTGLSPKKLEYLWKGYTGSMGAYALSATDMLINTLSDGPARPAIESRDVPVIKSFYQGTAAARSTQYTTDLYDRLHEVQEIIGSIKKNTQEANQEGARELIDENRDKLGAAELLSNASEDMSGLRKQQVAILRDRSLTPDQKRERMNQIIERINEISKQVSAKTNKAFAY